MGECMGVISVKVDFFFPKHDVDSCIYLWGKFEEIISYLYADFITIAIFSVDVMM